MQTQKNVDWWLKIWPSKRQTHFWPHVLPPLMIFFCCQMTKIFFWLRELLQGETENNWSDLNVKLWRHSQTKFRFKIKAADKKAKKKLIIIFFSEQDITMKNMFYETFLHDVKFYKNMNNIFLNPRMLNRQENQISLATQ